MVRSRLFCLAACTKTTLKGILEAHVCETKWLAPLLALLIDFVRWTLSRMVMICRFAAAICRSVTVICNTMAVIYCSAVAVYPSESLFCCSVTEACCSAASVFGCVAGVVAAAVFLAAALACRTGRVPEVFASSFVLYGALIVKRTRGVSTEITRQPRLRWGRRSNVLLKR